MGRGRSSTSAADDRILFSEDSNLKIWNSLFGKLFMTFLISMVPVLELRGAIPIGVAHRTGLPRRHRGVHRRQPCAGAVHRTFHPQDLRVAAHEKRAAQCFCHAHGAACAQKVGHRAPRALLGPVPLCGHSAAWHRRVDGSLIAAMLEMRVREALPPIALGVVTAGIIVAVVTYGAASLLF